VLCVQRRDGQIDAEANRIRTTWRATVEHEVIMISQDAVGDVRSHPIHGFVDLGVISQDIPEAKNRVRVREVSGNRLDGLEIGMHVADDGQVHKLAAKASIESSRV
jgi:hypothetical protein